MTKLLLALAAGTLLALAFVAVKNRHRFRYRPGALPAAEFQQLGRRGFATDAVAVEPGVVLRGLVRPPAAKDGGWLLFLPGNGSGLLRGAQELLLQLAEGHGWGLATWAYRGFDGSGGTPRAEALAADVERLCDRLRTGYGADPQRVHLASFSLGTALALRLAGALTARGTPPASLVLLAPYDRIVVAPDTWWSPWSFGDEYDALAHARSSSCPVLLVHGNADDAVPVAAARRLAAALGPRARLLELPGRGHSDWCGDAAVLRQVREFLAAQAPPRK